MCRSPTAKAAAGEGESFFSQDDGPPTARSSKSDDFTFGTTRPLELPKIQPETEPERPSAPHPASADIQAPSELHNTSFSDDEFTFGTTTPLVLPDFRNQPRQEQHAASTSTGAAVDRQVSFGDEVAGCVASSREADAVTSGDLASEMLAVRSISPRSRSHETTNSYSHAQIVEAHHAARELHATGEYLAVSYQPAPCPQLKLMACSFPAAGVSAVDSGFWSVPAPVVPLQYSLPGAHPYALPAQSHSFGMDAGPGGACAHSVTAETIDPDPETGIMDLAAGIISDSPMASDKTPQTPGSWDMTTLRGSSWMRRAAAACAIFVFLICIVVLSVLIFKDS